MPETADATVQAVKADPAFRSDVLSGLAEPIPSIPARWLYDRRGSELFDDITRLPSYYPTRTETALLEDILPRRRGPDRDRRRGHRIRRGIANQDALAARCGQAQGVRPDRHQRRISRRQCGGGRRRPRRRPRLSGGRGFHQARRIYPRKSTDSTGSASFPDRRSAISCRAARPTCFATFVISLAPDRSC